MSSRLQRRLDRTNADGPDSRGQQNADEPETTGTVNDAAAGSSAEKLWDEQQRAARARADLDYREWRKNFALVLAAVVLTVAGASALAQCGRPVSIVTPEEDRDGSAAAAGNPTGIGGPGAKSARFPPAALYAPAAMSPTFRTRSNSCDRDSSDDRRRSASR